MAVNRFRLTLLIHSSDSWKLSQGDAHLPKQQLQQSSERLTAISVVCRAGRGAGVVEGVEVADPGEYFIVINGCNFLKF